MEHNGGVVRSAAEVILNDLLLNGGVLGNNASMVIKAIGEIRAMESRSDDLATNLILETKLRMLCQMETQYEQEKNNALKRDIDQKNHRELEIGAEVAKIQRQAQAEHEALSEALDKERAEVLKLTSMNASLTRKNRDTLEKLMELARLSGFIVIID